MSSIGDFQIFKNRNLENAENLASRTTPNKMNIDNSRLSNPDHHANESSCGSSGAHLELTQQENEELTQRSNNNSAVKQKPPVHNSNDRAWGLLRRQGGTQEEFELHHRIKDLKRDTYTIGRSSKCDVTVADTWVSTTHCMVYCDYTQPKLRMFIEDCSANGTYVNDSLTRLRKNERMELKSGDEIFLLNPRKPENVTKLYASFVYINLRERMVAFREISYAPVRMLTGFTKLSPGAVQNGIANAPINPHSMPYAPHIEDKYIIGDQIGSGMSGQVYFCVNKVTKEHYAVKMIETKKFSLNPGKGVYFVRSFIPYALFTGFVGYGVCGSAYNNIIAYLLLEFLYFSFSFTYDSNHYYIQKGLSVADLRDEAILMREFDHVSVLIVLLLVEEYIYM